MSAASRNASGLSRMYLTTHLGRQVLKNSRAVHSSGSSDAAVTRCSVFQVPVDSADWKLEGKRENNLGYASIQTNRGSMFLEHSLH